MGAGVAIVDPVLTMDPATKAAKAAERDAAYVDSLRGERTRFANEGKPEGVAHVEDLIRGALGLPRFHIARRRGSLPYRPGTSVG